MHPQIPEVITGESIHRVTPTRLFGPHDTFLTTVAYSDDGLRMVTGDIGGNLRIWEVETGQLVARQRVFTTSVLGAVFKHTHNDGVYELTAAANNNAVRVLHIGPDNTIREQSSLKLDDFKILRLGYGTAGRPLVACIP
ncbi:MAG: hypothetical protein AAF653_19680, partial [Chloroflexota bacterium]